MSDSKDGFGIKLPMKVGVPLNKETDTASAELFIDCDKIKNYF